MVGVWAQVRASLRAQAQDSMGQARQHGVGDLVSILDGQHKAVGVHKGWWGHGHRKGPAQDGAGQARQHGVEDGMGKGHLERAVLRELS